MFEHTLYRVPRSAGLQLLQRRGAGVARELTTRRWLLAAGQSDVYQSRDEETVLVLLEGTAVWEAGGERWSVGRRGVFAERATALYIPPNVAVTVTARSALEAILVATPAAAASVAVLIGPDAIRAESRGGEGFRREVYDLFVADQHPRRLMVGETVSSGGQWSSYPPHKHDGGDGEPRLEEVYYFRIEPHHGFGVQVQYAAGAEAVAHVVRDGDAVLLPSGYHPVAAAPGYRLYYLWALAGDARRLVVHEDPQHRWVHQGAP
jgi:5-deoxy-glucuronate isomerase